jgi:hypothetical protein
MKAVLMTLFSVGLLLFLMIAYALGGNFYGSLADRFPDAREQITWMWRDVLVPFWKVLILLVGGHFFMRCVRWSANRVSSKHDTVYLGRCALWLMMEIVVAGLFALTAGIAAFSPRFAFPAWLATMPDAVRKCLDFMVDMAVAGFVYFAVWSFADWLSCLCSRFDGDGRKQDVRM